MRLLMLTLALLAGAQSAAADTLGDAMATAAETNPALAAQRQRLNATREALPQAWAEALPQITVSGLGLRSDRDGDGPGIDTPSSETWTASATGSQLLFGSGRVLASTRAARAQIRGAAANYEFTLQSLLLDVTRAYADVRQAQAVVAARETTVSNLTRLFEFAQAQFEAGVVTRTDVAQSQARLAQARTQLVQAQGGLAAAAQAYLRLVGRAPSDLTAPEEVQGLPQDLDAALAVAARDNLVLRAANAGAEQADASVDVAASQGRLRVTFEAAAGEGADFNNEDLTQTTTDSVGVRVAVPLFQGGLVRSRTRAQRALRAAANLDLADAQRRVQESVTNAWTGLASARAAVDSAREQVQDRAASWNERAQAAGQALLVDPDAPIRPAAPVVAENRGLMFGRRR